MFHSQSEAKTFFVDKIVAQAEAEGQSLSLDELWMLRFSESDPEFVVDPARVEQLEAEISDSEYEEKIAGLLKRRFERDVKSDMHALTLYGDAYSALRQGDHYVLVIIDQALPLR